MTVNDVAKALGVPNSRVHSWNYTGKLLAVSRPSGTRKSWRISAEEFRRLSQTQTKSSDMMTVNDVAKLQNVPPHVVRYWIIAGKLAAKRQPLGNRRQSLRIAPDEYRRFIEGRELSE